MSKTVFLLIRSLEIGGAERQLALLARGLHVLGIKVVVLTFYGNGPLAGELVQAGVPVVSLRKSGRWDVFPFLFRLVKEMRKYRPQIIYSFLPVANVVSAFVKPFCSGLNVVWGVRASNVDAARHDWLSHAILAIEARLSRVASKIIVNSHAGLKFHAGKGFPVEKMLVIPNGIDMQCFKFDPAARARWRLRLGLAENDVLIGTCARIDPIKGYETFIEAAALCIADRPDVRFVCIGDGDKSYRDELVAMARGLGVGDERMIWLGSQSDIAAIYSALDIYTSASRSEGFSNAIAEAMSCDRACVVTDVGDSAWIVDGAGYVVPGGDAAAMAGAWLELLSGGHAARERLGLQARGRISDIASEQSMVNETFKVMGSLAG